MALDARARAILWAQYRTILNFYRKPKMGGFWVGTIVMIVWYLMVAAGAVGIGALVAIAREARFPLLEVFIAFGLLLGFLYWQVVPVFLASTGMSIDSRRLLVYPVRPSQLFQIEVLLRVTTGVEVILVMLGLGVGALLNPTLPKWGAVAVPVFLIFNLYLSAGVRDWIGRVMERKGAREAMVVLLVLLTVTPQMLTLLGVPPAVKNAVLSLNQSWLPWGATAGLLLGKNALLHGGALLVWTLAAMVFGRWQFEKSLRFDKEGARAGQAESTRSSAWLDLLYALPGRLFGDPLAALLEKDLRQLARAPRFRAVFFMGFIFGLAFWLPLVFRKGLLSGTAEVSGPFSANYLTVLSLYSMMLLGEVALFNSLGFDRAAAQIYFAAPLPLRTMFLSKNLAVAVAVFLELSFISAACLLLRLPVSGGKVLEAFCVTLTMGLYLVGMGNLGTVYSPRAADPQESWRNSSGSKFQLWMILIYPCLGVPIFFAYLARYAFESQAAFYVVLAVTALIGLAFRWVATDTAVELAEERREKILTALGEGSGPIR